MALIPPIVKDGILTYLWDGEPAQIVVDSASWFAWLETATKFTFCSEQGHFTARKERAGHQRGKLYWRAYHTLDGSLHRVYLGQSEALTLSQLQSVAARLCGTRVGEDNFAGQVLGVEAASCPSAVASVQEGLCSGTEPSFPQFAGAKKLAQEGCESNRVDARHKPYGLPKPLTTFFGREREIAEVATLLRDTSVRLVTLTGAGGVGKTRLALSLAAEVADFFADGVCFVHLAPVSDPEQVMSTVAEALGLWDALDHAYTEAVQDFLRKKHLLLLIDNFEQVATASTEVAALAAFCPRLHLLMTSRVALHLSGEYEYPVPPLPTPDLTQLPARRDLAQIAAIQLFVERARAILPSFALTDANSRTIAEICVRLDGLPLAIELAAARIKLLPPQALLIRLSRRLEILTGGARDLPSRQRTLRNTIQWSYDLLTYQEQRLFRLLAVFVGGCTLHAATAVCNNEGDESGEPLDVLEGAASLVDKNFVLQTEQEGDEPRLLILETMREYGLESLEASRERETTCRVHARYYLRLAEEALVHLEDVEQGVRLERLERESANMRAALLWAVEHQESEVALRLGGALFRFWEARRYLREGKSFLDRALASSQSIPAHGRAKALYTTGFLTTFQRGIERVVLLGREAGIEHRDLGDSHKLAFSFYLLAYIAWATGDFATARSHIEEGLAVVRGSDETVILASLLVLLGQVAFDEGVASRARALLEEGLALQRASGNTHGSIFTLSHLIRVLFAQDEVSLARIRNEERLVLSRELDFHWGIADSLTVQGHLALQGGNVAGAEELFKESLEILRAVNDNGAVAACLHSIGLAIAIQGRLVEAAWLWGASEAMCITLGESVLPVELALAARGVLAVRAELGMEAFTTAWTQGRAMTPEQAFAMLLQSSSSITYKQASPSATNELTAREMEVLRLLVEGLTNAQIAKRLVIGLVTVNSHVRSIYSKLGVSSRAAATRFAMEHQLL